MADTLITPAFRCGFVALFRPSKPKDSKPDQQPKYSVRALFPPSTDLSAFKQMASKAALDKWGTPEKLPKNMRSPFRKNAELDTPVAGVPDDWIVMTFSAPHDRRPGLVDGKRNDIIDESLVYSGMWARAEVRAYAYDQQGNKGVAFGLQNVQKLRDDEPLGGASMPASKVFDAVDGAESAADIFS